jgi:uncharacterized membrane protein
VDAYRSAPYLTSEQEMAILPFHKAGKFLDFPQAYSGMDPLVIWCVPDYSRLDRQRVQHFRNKIPRIPDAAVRTIRDALTWKPLTLSCIRKSLSCCGESVPHMNKTQPGLCLFVTGLIGLGIIAVIVGDFAMVWQPVPEWVPARHAVAVGTGVLMILLGVGLSFGVSRAWAVRILLVYLVVWAALKIPAVIAAPKMEAVYLGLGELTLLLSGGWTLFAHFAGLAPGSPLGFLAGERGIRMARYLFAISIIPIGLSHLVYADITAGYVPHWLPYRVGWAYLTGAGQMASGVGVLFGVLPRVAAWAEAGQIALYTFLVWGAAILSAPKTRLAWTAFFISWIFGAAAWVVAQNVPAKSSKVAPNS